MKFKFFHANWQTPIEDAKREYHRLVMKYHPDHGGSDEAMAQINVEWDYLYKHNYNVHRNMEGEVYTDENQDAPDDLTRKYVEIINALIKLEGVVVEICGSFIWLSGNTYEWREILKAMGFKYSRKKKMWYMAPTKRRRRSNDWSIERIRAKHGSFVVTEGMETNNFPRLKAAKVVAAGKRG